jgi:regulator of protease activity HflC (stomatin/prohibitin superfamily)
MGLEIVLAVAALAILGTSLRTLRVVPQARVGLIQRLGTYHRTAESDLAVVLPFVDQMLPLLDLREQVISFPPQPVITADNVPLHVTSVIYYQIISPTNATW